MAREKEIRRVQVPTYVPPKLKLRIEAAAKRSKLSVARWIEYVVEAYLES